MIDQELARNDYIEKNVSPEYREDYLAEPEMAETEMMEVLSADLAAMARERAAALGDGYPYIIAADNSLVAQNGGNRAVAGAYTCVQAMRLAQAEKIEIIAATDSERRAATKALWRVFERVFEYVSAYTVSGNWEGLPIVLSNCRSSRRLHEKLSGICRRVRSGRVRTYDDWSRVQRASNDGGVDAVVHVGGPGMPGNAHFYIVSATYQQKKIDQKIMGPEARQRFSEYFAERPAVFYGVLVRLGDEDDLTLEKCRGKDCLFYGYEKVLNYMGRRSNDPHLTRALKVIDNRVGQAIRSLDRVVLDNNGQECEQLLAQPQLR